MNIYKCGKCRKVIPFGEFEIWSHCRLCGDCRTNEQVMASLFPEDRKKIPSIKHRPGMPRKDRRYY